MVKTRDHPLRSPGLNLGYVYLDKLAQILVLFEEAAFKKAATDTWVCFLNAAINFSSPLLNRLRSRIKLVLFETKIGIQSLGSP